MAETTLITSPLLEAFISEYFTSDFLPYPNDYVGLVHWLNIQRAIGNDWYAKYNGNRAEMARQLTQTVGWLIDDFAFRRAEKRLFQSKRHYGSN